MTCLNLEGAIESSHRDLLSLARIISRRGLKLTKNRLRATQSPSAPISGPVPPGDGQWQHPIRLCLAQQTHRHRKPPDAHANTSRQTTASTMDTRDLPVRAKDGKTFEYVPDLPSPLEKPPLTLPAPASSPSTTNTSKTTTSPSPSPPSRPSSPSSPPPTTPPSSRPSRP
jgi:hypothetical protein